MGVGLSGGGEMTRRRLRIHLPVGGILIAVALVACRETVTPRPPAENLTAFEGDGQSAERLDTLPQPLVARVVDDGGEPVRGAVVIWSSSDPDARFVSTDGATDDDGLARATVILGFTPGDQHIEARTPGFDDVARFTATAMSVPGFKAIALMDYSGARGHMCALDVEKRAWCWGANYTGQLGNGSVEDSELPRLVATTERFERLIGTAETTCGLTAAGRLFCWGLNATGESGGVFGNGSLEDSRVPVPAGGGMSFAAFDLDWNTACGVTLAGEGYCWGGGALGTGVARIESTVPVPLAGGGIWREIAIGQSRGCAVSDAHEVWCWSAEQARRRIGVEASEALVPTAVEMVSSLSSLSMGGYNQCGMRSGHGAVCWGEWMPSATYAAPGPLYPRPAGEVFEWIQAAEATLVGRSISGRIWLWGEGPGGYGYISETPLALKPAGPWLDVALSEGAFAIHASDSTVWRWPAGELVDFPEGRTLLPVPVPAASEGARAD